ncbi:Mitogen-activated protein kinase kinase kinase 2, partial [Diplonema papillatum]
MSKKPSSESKRLFVIVTICGSIEAMVLLALSIIETAGATRAASAAVYGQAAAVLIGVGLLVQCRVEFPLRAPLLGVAGALLTAELLAAGVWTAFAFGSRAVDAVAVLWMCSAAGVSVAGGDRVELSVAHNVVWGALVLSRFTFAESLGSNRPIPNWFHAVVSLFALAAATAYVCQQRVHRLSLQSCAILSFSDKDPSPPDNEDPPLGVHPSLRADNDDDVEKTEILVSSVANSQEDSTSPSVAFGAPRKVYSGTGLTGLNASDGYGRALRSPIGRERRALQGQAVTWKRGALIGQGAFGKVHIALNTTTGELMAVKNVMFNTTDPNVKVKLVKLQNEIALMKSLDHPNVIRYLSAERSGDSVNIFMEYVPGGSVADLVNQFGALTSETVCFYTRQILLGLRYLHSQEVIHRDIKGANILITVTGECKLGDFGASALVSDLQGQRKKSVQGTPLWMAPEVLTQQEYTKSVDIWSLGCTIIEMTTGHAPFSHVDRRQINILQDICDSEKEMTIPPECEANPDLAHLVRSCLQKDPTLRPDASDLLVHPWTLRAVCDYEADSPTPPRAVSPSSAPIPANASAEKAGLAWTKRLRTMGVVVMEYILDTDSIDGGTARLARMKVHFAAWRRHHIRLRVLKRKAERERNSLRLLRTADAMLILVSAQLRGAYFFRLKLYCYLNQTRAAHADSVPRIRMHAPRLGAATPGESLARLNRLSSR